MKERERKSGLTIGRTTARTADVLVFVSEKRGHAHENRGMMRSDFPNKHLVEADDPARRDSFPGRALERTEALRRSGRVPLELLVVGLEVQARGVGVLGRLEAQAGNIDRPAKRPSRHAQATEGIFIFTIEHR